MSDREEFEEDKQFDYGNLGGKLDVEINEEAYEDELFNFDDE